MVTKNLHSFPSSPAAAGPTSAYPHDSRSFFSAADKIRICPIAFGWDGNAFRGHDIYVNGLLKFVVIEVRHLVRQRQIETDHASQGSGFRCAKRGPFGQAEPLALQATRPVARAGRSNHARSRIPL
jgi:hypothetical protein